MYYRRLIVSAAVLIALAASASAQPPVPKSLTPEQKEKLTERDRLSKESAELWRAGKLNEATVAVGKKLAIEREVFGNTHEDVAASLELLGRLHVEQEDWPAARAACRERVEVAIALSGKDGWRATDARLALADVDLHAAMTPADRADLRHAEGLNAEADRLDDQGKYVEAGGRCQEALSIRRRILGASHQDTLGCVNNLAGLKFVQGREDEAEGLYKEALAGFRKGFGDVHPATLMSINNLAGVYLDQARYAEAEPLFKEALAGRRKVRGNGHPETLSSVSYLARLYREQGRYAEAEPLFKEALAGRRKTLGDVHPNTLTTVNNLAGLNQEQGRFVEAELLYKEALAGRRKALGNTHQDTLTTVNNLALLYRDLGRNAEAEPLFKEALAGFRNALGDADRGTLTAINNLALFYQDQGRYSEAEPLFKESLSGKRKVLGDAHPDTLITINNLAGLYVNLGRYSAAEPLYKEALAGFRNAWGDAHPDTLFAINNLAGLYLHQARFAEAESQYKEALAGFRKSLGDAHPNTLTTISNLAGLYQDLGRYAAAEPLYREAVAGFRKSLGDAHPSTLASVNDLAMIFYDQGRNAEAEPLSTESLDGIINYLERNAVIQSETAQLANVAKERWYFTTFLKVTTKADAAKTYALVLRWRGAITARQTFARAARTEDPSAKALLLDLATVSRQISALANNPPPPEKKIDIPARWNELVAKRDDLEAKLAAQSASFASYVKNLALTPAELRKALPADTVLVDYVEYDGQLAAFVVRTDGISRVELGPVKTVATAVDGFRQTLNRVHPTTGKADDPAVVLRKTIWEPLAPHLKGAKLVLIGPEGSLSRLPFAALPGSDPDKYLIEEIALAVVPVPRMLPELRAPRPPRDDTPPSLLAVGDVDFDAVPPAAVAVAEPAAGVWKRKRAGAAKHWSRLPGTAGEIAELEVAFKSAVPGGKLTVLREKAATEAAVRAGLGLNEYLHLATHGYFADPSDSPKVVAPRDRGGLDMPRPVGQHPGLLSGLVFAGANKPRGDDDEVLTALEVADLDLSKVELAVLSACETGLGETAGGEGVLGLQRAFQMAGARTTITSLWKVDDDATHKLMGRFYANLWKENKGTLESLRSAQLEMLAKGVGRGMTKLEEGPPDPRPKRTPPYYWAAFVLAGDWR